jgi:putative solute:sodium symporter small subunit
MPRQGHELFSAITVNMEQRSEGGKGMNNPMHVYWKTNKIYMTILLSVWALVSYGFGIVFVEELNAFYLGGFPLGFWFAQQGSIFVFVLLILVYFLLMDRLDKKFDVHE